jgi:hypothetical protein
MEVTGAVHNLGESITVSASYEKRELVIKTDEQYPQFIAIEFAQGKCNEILDTLSIGTNIKVGINIGGREWVNPQGETKYFNSIKGWRIEKLAVAQAPSPQSLQTTDTINDEVNGMPF